MLNVLIVGGAGYVGGALTDALRDTLWSLRVYDRLLYDEQYLKPLDFRHVRSFIGIRPQGTTQGRT